MENIREYLDTKEKFEPLLNYFVSKAIEEEIIDENRTEDELSFFKFMKTYLEYFPSFNSDVVFKYSESPIEKIFLNSLTLLFVKNTMLGPWYDKPRSIIPKFLCEFRAAHENILKLEEDYILRTGDEKFENFDSFQENQIRTGKFTFEDFDVFNWHRTIVKYFGWDSYRIILQPNFSDVEVNGKRIRPDLLIWKPSDDQFKLVVEYDGFKYHSNKRSFENDRIRDRKLKIKGYDVIRFSGGEIWRDPVAVSEELFDYLETIDKNKEKAAHNSKS
jgi:hypothetical protein